MAAAESVRMDLLNLFWPDLICTALAFVFLNAALTGEFYTHGRGGGKKLIASTKSLTARIAFLIIAVLLVVWIVWDLKHKSLHS